MGSGKPVTIHPAGVAVDTVALTKSMTRAPVATERRVALRLWVRIVVVAFTALVSFFVGLYTGLIVSWTT